MEKHKKWIYKNKVEVDQDEQCFQNLAESMTLRMYFFVLASGPQCGGYGV